MNVFICNIPLHYYFFRSIYKNLENSEFLIPPMSDSVLSKEYGGGLSAQGIYNYTKNFLKRKNVKISDYGEINIKNIVNYLNRNADNVICAHLFDGIYDLSRPRLIKIVYGIPSDTRSLKYEYIYLMDLIITFGSESADRISKKMINSIPVGNPLFDDWFSNEINENSLRIIEKRLDSEKQTILYLPTWNKDSSLDIFFEEIASLIDEYNIIVKLHHSTFIGEANRLCKCLSYPEIISLGDYFDPLPLYKASDIIITDGVSGATFDALLLDKPVLTVGSSIKNYGIDGIEMKPALSNILNSIPFIDDPTKLRGSLKKIARESFVFDQDIKYSLFFHIDGQAGKRAAEAILDEKKYPATPTFEKYEKAIKIIENSKMRKILIERKNYFLSMNNSGYLKKFYQIKYLFNRF